MKHFVERTCTEINEKESRDAMQGDSKLLQEFRDAEAYVLLGGPGLGKTTAFELEQAAAGGTYVTARDFLTFDDRPEWHKTTLFIDGLDEIRAGKADGRTSVDAIRKKLHKLGCPQFRLSCRETDWFGANDRERLRTVSRSAKIRVLRLDQLSDQNIREMLQARQDVQDVDAFLNAARSRAIDGLLKSPQSLEMLADAVAVDDWPLTRTETLDLACRRLLREHNQEHQMAIGSAPDSDSLMHAAGRLCGLQLLAGKAGYTLLSDLSDNQEYLRLEQVSGEEGVVLEQALGTKLFSTKSGCATPVHRQVAEFLAGQYLAACIRDKGLPLGRILSLMTGSDGTVVSELRGLAAWLAVHCRSSRREIIGRDPLGVVLYGDTREFSVEEKRLILQFLQQEVKQNPAFLNRMHMDSRLGDLATPCMEGEIRGIISSPSRSDAQQSLVWILLISLAESPPLPALTDLLLSIVRDETREQETRRLALDVYIHNDKGGEHLVELKKILDDIKAQEVLDPEQRLQLRLLDALYPSVLSPTKLISHLPVSASPLPMSLEIFFARVVPGRSDGARAAELMEGLIEKFEDLLEAYSVGPAHNIYMLSGMIENTLLRALEDAGRSIDPEKLYDWLGVASDPRVGQGSANHEGVQKIRDWLSNQPDMQKSLINVGLARSAEDPDALGIERRLFGAVPPNEFGPWCLKAAETADRVPVSQFFLVKAMDADYGNESAHQIIEKWLDGNPRLLGLYKEIQNERNQFSERTKKHLKNYDHRFRERVAEQRRKRRERHYQVKEQESSLRENRASPPLLFFLAKGYLGGFGDVRGATPQDRLRDLLDDDEALVQVVLQSFRETISRDDLPDVRTILDLDAQSKLHFLTLPFVAGLHELSLEAPNGELGLSEEQMRLAIAIYFLVPLWPLYSAPEAPPADQEPNWFEFFLQRHPGVVADVLIQSAKEKLRRGSHSISGTHQLARDTRYRDVARLASLPLLEGFPVRCKESRLSDLRDLLYAACLYGDMELLANLIERKLASRSMNVGQRVFWLAAGLVVMPDEYTGELDSYVAGNERRIKYLAWLLARWYDTPAAIVELFEVSSLELLVRHVGFICKPYPAASDSTSREGGFVTPVMEAGLSVGACINRLASSPSEAAASALAELSSDHRLSAWRSELQDASERQKVIQREAEFEHCHLAKVLRTLDNSTPANSADLAALTVDYLLGLSQKIRLDNTSDWRQYWDKESPQGTLVPVHENVGRNALLSDLRIKLENLGIDAQPEGQHAGEKRSDIRVSYGGELCIPIEVKKSCSPDLWTAIRKQLIERYACDRGADGYGIYLVLWFGDAEYCRPTPGLSSPPRSAADLQEQLLGTLSGQERRKISVCVIDVAKPRK